MRKVDRAKHEAKRLDILAAAESCFTRKGFRGASIAEVCSAARISPGHLYHYFSGKEAIVAGIARFRLKAAIEMMRDIVDGPDPFGAFIKEICRPVLGRGPEAGSLLLELLAEAGRNPEIGVTVREQSATIISLFGDVLRAGQASGKVDPALDPEPAASILAAVVIDGMKALIIREPDVDCDKAADMVELLVTRFLSAH